MFKVAAFATTLFALASTVLASTNADLQTVTDSTIIRANAEANTCVTQTIKNPGQMLITNPDYLYQYENLGHWYHGRPRDYVVIDVREKEYYKDDHLDDSKNYPVKINDPAALAAMQNQFKVGSIDQLPKPFRKSSSERYVIIHGNANSITGAQVALAYWTFVKTQPSLAHQNVVLLMGGYEAAYAWRGAKGEHLDFDKDLI